MTTDEFLDAAIAERDAVIERRVREEIAARLVKWGIASGDPAFFDAATIARGGAA